MDPIYADQPPHIAAMLADARAAGEAAGAQRERVAVLGFLRNSEWASVNRAAAYIEGGYHNNHMWRLVFDATQERARAEGEAAGYRRAIDEACAALDKRYAALERRLVDDDHYGAGRLRGLDLAEEIVRALAPVEPVSNADKLPGGDR